MALASRDEVTFSSEELSRTKKEMEDLLSDPAVLNEAKQLREELPNDAPADLIKTLDIIIRTCQCNDMSSSPEAKTIREETSKIESDLEMARNSLKLGYTDPATGDFHEMSSVGLRNLMRTSPDEATRKAAYEGLRSIGPFVCSNGFVDIVKKRNQLAKQLGFEDYYDYKVTNAEGFNKQKLFEILDGLEEGTRPLMVEGRKELERRFGESALEPWNTSFMMAGSVVKKMDPYFPFSKSVERYIRSYAALGISYAGATMNLDLLDRAKKYSNGFCHWPKPAWQKPDGTWQPSVANFTSLADPSAVGSGLTALTTLMHEAGHAAHMANVKQPSPLFSQERAPTSVAYAENQVRCKFCST
jgi:oligoendopeptidase F